MTYFWLPIDSMGQTEGFAFQNHMTRRIALDTKRVKFQKDTVFRVGGVAKKMVTQSSEQLHLQYQTF